MKEKLFLLLLLLCGVLVSCDKNTGIDGEYPESGIDSKLEKEGEEVSDKNGEDEEQIVCNFSYNPEGTMMDGDEVGGVNLYCWEKKYSVTPRIEGGDYRFMTKTIDDYSQMELRLEIKRNGQYRVPDIAETARIGGLQVEYSNKKSLFIYDEYVKYRDQFHIGWPFFFAAYVNGKVTLTCDKALFGKGAGENLSEHFHIYSVARCMPVGIESPYLLYNFCDELPIYMSEYFPKETWIQSLYYLDMPVAPEEKYDELTFHITMPIKKESIRRSIAQGANGVDKPMQMIDEVYEADCLIKFNW